MSILVTPTKAPVPRTKDAAMISILYAVFLVILAVTQLFTFDTFLQLLGTFDLPGGEQGAYLLGSLLVVSEVFALPFLLRMSMSPAFRWLSIGLGWLAAALWVFISLWLVLTEPIVINVGFLGTLTDLMPGWWAVLVSVSLLILAIWSSWGMWPAKVKK